MVVHVTRRLASGLALALSLAACGGGGNDSGGAAQRAADAVQAPTAQAEAASEAGYTVVAVENGGTIRGTVRFLGSVPAARTVQVTEDTDACGETIQIQTLEVDSGQGLANTVVSLTDISQGVALGASASPRGIDQRGCRFTPHAQLAGIGQVVEIRNSDPVSHNIHTVAFDNRPINRMQPPALEKLEVTFRAPEKVKVKCDIHEWMSGWIVVIEHPYHDITGTDGSFVLENVPPGTYTLEVWHEDLGSTTRTVTVTAGQSTEASFELGATSPQS